MRTQLLVIVDQLDELLGREFWEEDRRNFARVLNALLATGRIWIVATLRSDLYERFHLDPNLFALKRRGSMLDIRPPDPLALAQIIAISAAVSTMFTPIARNWSSS